MKKKHFFEVPQLSNRLEHVQLISSLFSRHLFLAKEFLVGEFLVSSRGSLSIVLTLRYYYWWCNSSHTHTLLCKVGRKTSAAQLTSFSCFVSSTTSLPCLWSKTQVNSYNLLTYLCIKTVLRK